jgi:hypothetical protein
VLGGRAFLVKRPPRKRTNRKRRPLVSQYSPLPIDHRYTAKQWSTSFSLFKIPLDWGDKAALRRPQSLGCHWGRGRAQAAAPQSSWLKKVTRSPAEEDAARGPYGRLRGSSRRWHHRRILRRLLTRLGIADEINRNAIRPQRGAQVAKGPQAAWLDSQTFTTRGWKRLNVAITARSGVHWGSFSEV